MRQTLTTLLAALALLALVLPAARAGDEEAVQKEADVKAQYAAAALLQKQVTGQKGEERRAAQQRAAAAFEAVARYFPEEQATAGLALYQAAEIHEVLRDRDKAVGCLNRVFQMQAEDLVKARAHNLLGHIYRRARSFADAIKEYEAVLGAGPKAETEAAEAMGWIGKCKAQLGDQQGAREVWKARAERFPKRHALVVESYDWIACSLHREGKVEEARRTLEACRARLAAAAADTGPAGHRVRKALGNMRILKLLESGETKS
ncbi:MAG: tetratricopeptide repeat protein [Planctomycetes bacterium]|nr:tetratricopeptide repeat protein [Planctomycetota bacterium]